ncbi:MAG: recombinase family protein [Clostridia bacterium]
MNYLKIANPIDYKVALYIRLSKEDEKPGESESISNQRSMLTSFAKDQRLTIIDEYVDDGISGTTFDRPSFKRMLVDIESKKVNMVITKDLSRLGRDYIQTGFYLEKYFPENRVRYVSILDGVDTGIDSCANDITPFKSILNDMYAKDISSKIKSVKHNKQDLGLFIGGKAPYGYIINKEEKNKIIIDIEVAPIIKHIFSEAKLRKIL